MSLPYHGVSSLSAIPTNQNDKTNSFMILKVPTTEQHRRDSMKFRRKVYARFEKDNALESTSLSGTSNILSKNRKKRRFKKKKPHINTSDIPQVANTSIPIAPNEIKLAAVTEPRKVTPIKIKMSRCEKKEKKKRYNVCYEIS